MSASWSVGELTVNLSETFQSSRVESLFLQANWSWISHWTLCLNQLVFDSMKQVSFQSTWSLHYSKLKQLLEAASPILPVPPEDLNSISWTVLESEEMLTQSLVEFLHNFLISVNIHISSSYPQIILCHLSCDITWIWIHAQNQPKELLAMSMVLASRLCEKLLRPQKNLLRWEVQQPWICLQHQQLSMHT